MALVSAYVALLKRFRFIVILFWAACLAIGVWQGLNLLSHTTISLEPPSGSASAKAEDLFKREFPAVGNTVPTIVVLQRPQGNLLCNATRNFTYALLEAVVAYPGGYMTPGNFQSYFTLLDQGLGDLADRLQKDNITIFVMNVDVPGDNGMTTDCKNFVDFLDDTMHSLADRFFPGKDVTVLLTGDLVFGRDVEEGTEHDILLMDGAAFPVALLILAFVLRSLRLLIIPVLCIAVSILTSFALVYPIALSTMTVSFTPSLMMSTTIAMSIDYSLFLLSRFREELLALRPAETAITIMLETSGHTVIVSGATICFCFAGLAFFQVAMLSIPGLATAISLFVAVTVNITLTPALLLTFPKFFSRCVQPLRWPWQPPPSYAEATTPLLHLHGGMQQVAVLPDSMALRSSRWFRMGRFITRYSLVVVALVVGLAVPCAMRAVEFDRTMSILSFTPRTSEATKAYELLGSTFGTGMLFPYDLIAIPPPTMPILGKDFFDAMGDIIINDLMTLPVPADYLGIMVEFDQVIPFINITDPTCFEFCNAVKTFVNTAQTATYIEIHLDFPGNADPFGPSGKDWLDQARAVLDSASQRTGIQLSLAAGAAAEFDIIDKVYGVFPTAIGVTTAVVFVLTGLAFRSLLVPARAVLSIALTLAYVYACEVWVFQVGVLDFLNYAPLTGRGALSWIAPVMAFSVLVGLGLDYDIFLLTRIREYRAMGVADPGQEEANNVLMGLTLTGGVITAAGAIMAVAFVGLLFSAEPVLNELSFFLVFAVLFDTLVVRTMLVPSLMTLLGRWNWWPMMAVRKRDGYATIQSDAKHFSS